MYIYDHVGNAYLDCAAGIAVVNINHSVKSVFTAIAKQAEEICFVYGGTFATDARIRLAEQVIAMSPPDMDKIFFCSAARQQWNH